MFHDGKTVHLDVRQLALDLLCSEIVNKNHSTSGSGPFPHFPSREITLAVENDFKPHHK